MGIENHILEDSKDYYNKNKDFTSLICWEDAQKVKIYFYEQVIQHVPDSEKYNLNIQIRKAAISITANISEGYGRFHYQEGIQFYRISRGSLYELKDHLISCHILKYVDSALFNEGINLIEKTKISLNGYINYVKKLKDNQ